jgi:hypothetical protein
MTRPSALAVVAATLLAAGCGKPGVDGLRESFAQQLAANTSVKDFQRSADGLRFTGPGADGSVARWRVQIDSAVIEPSTELGKPYKGVVKSSWYADDHKVTPDAFESNLPLELISTGLAQDCWALWNQADRKWEW